MVVLINMIRILMKSGKLTNPDPSVLLSQSVEKSFFHRKKSFEKQFEKIIILTQLVEKSFFEKSVGKYIEKRLILTDF